MQEPLEYNVEVYEDNEFDFTFTSDESSALVPDLCENLNDVIDKVRSICRLFRNSPMENFKLQEFVFQMFGQTKLHLILHVKTRWNSLLYMIERFLKLKPCIHLALIAVESDLLLHETD